MKEELEKLGTLVGLLIPRRGRFVGAIYATFASMAMAVAAAGVLATRSFAGKPVLVAYESDATLAAATAESA